MSHRDSCPDPNIARREGRRAFEGGRSRWGNPYKDGGDQPCEEAEREWSAGHRAAERDQDEARQRADYERQEDERRAQQQAERDMLEGQQ
jgi:hypothetical protein